MVNWFHCVPKGPLGTLYEEVAGTSGELQVLLAPPSEQHSLCITEVQWLQGAEKLEAKSLGEAERKGLTTSLVHLQLPLRTENASIVWLPSQAK